MTHAGEQAPACVLFALAPFETARFFPNGLVFDSAESCIVKVWDPSNEPSKWPEILRNTKPTVVVSAWYTPPLTEELLAATDGQLRYLCHVVGSVRGLVPRSVLERGLLVSNWGTTVSFQVAEHALLLILGVLRNAGKWSSSLRDPAAWQLKERLSTRSLRHRRVGIHGFGSIARSLISLLRPFEVRCFAHSEGVSPDFISAHGATPCSTLGELCINSEIFVECEALTPATKGVITEHYLNLLPENSVFINVARGALVDEAALARTAKSRSLRIASDVFQIEPLPVDSPLRDCADVFFSPHIGGPTHDSYTACGGYALRNLERFLRGEPVESVVTTEIYDRST